MSTRTIWQNSFAWGTETYIDLHVTVLRDPPVQCSKIPQRIWHEHFWNLWPPVLLHVLLEGITNSVKTKSQRKVMEIEMALTPPDWTGHERRQKNDDRLGSLWPKNTHDEIQGGEIYLDLRRSANPFHNFVHTSHKKERNLGWSLDVRAAVPQNIMLWFERRRVEKVKGAWTIGRGKDLPEWPSGQEMLSTLHPGKGSLRSTRPICSRRGKWHIIGSRPDKGSVYITLPDTGLT